MLLHAAFWAPDIEQLAANVEGQAAIERAMEYLGRAAGEDSVSLEELAEVIVRNAPGSRQAIMDSVDKLIERGRREGMEKGIEKGIEQGIEQGRAEERRAVLREMLERRFGPLSDAHELTIEAATYAALRQLFDRAISADSLAAVFGPPTE